MPIDACRQFFFIMSDHYESFILSFTESADDVFYESSVPVVKAVQRFVEYE